VLYISGALRRTDTLFYPGPKLTALVCHLTKKVNKAEELAYFTLGYSLTFFFSEFKFRHLKLAGLKELNLPVIYSCP
jgi:hypothetical protein